MTASRYRVLTLNNISSSGLARLDGARYDIGSGVDDPDAILVRSADMHAMDLPASVKCIGRAGSGTNNIPVAAMTTRGIPVFNAPGANANAVKELVIAGLIMAARSLAPAWQFARGLQGDDATLHKAVESRKKAYAGFEISGRTIAVIGLGAIGGRVANAALALGMRVVGYDPGLTPEAAWQIDSRVRQARSLDEALAGADAVSLHVPLVPATRALLNADRLSLLSRGAIVCNFAREGVVDEAAIVAALDAGQLHAYVSDFPTAATKDHPRCVTLPHLGASTAEAEDNCAVMVADQTRDFLERGDVRNAVNFPQLIAPAIFAHRVIAAGTSAAAIAAVEAALTGVGVVTTSQASKGDLHYAVIDLRAAAGVDVLASAAGQAGVVMVRSIA
jgi:D-3-phosphoglycerate dehydrogenase